MISRARAWAYVCQGEAGLSRGLSGEAGLSRGLVLVTIHGGAAVARSVIERKEIVASLLPAPR